ncbi:synaptojanin,inositol polyphosphate phosphatase [Trypanosoma cruzi cruzi]|uniref:Putative synaptojanin n=1 Tax=Trypanosoma cruzi TaxID=5693 RepID=A0A2V2VEM1_TRYCR|nr:synaptojanin,inositol polyphosphate phosphatase [Trypanosoma cruzi cruzi]PWU94036.1 putative synaptojanin [Trypanosoma cruzi]
MESREGSKTASCSENGGGWRVCDASLHPVRSLVLDRICIYDQPSHCCVIGTDAAKKEYRVLHFKKSNSEVLKYRDDAAYTPALAQALIERETREANTQVLRAKALLGCIRFTKGYYLLVATRRQCVARLGCHRIFEVTDVELVSLCIADPKSMVLLSGAGSSPFLQPRTLEDYYRSQFLSNSLKQNFYYSHTYDLTNTLQMNMTRARVGYRVRSKFVWNEFLLKPFFSSSASCHASFVSAKEEETLLVPAAVEQWIVYLTHGSIVQCPVVCGLKPLLITLIGRVSKNFAGVRYLRRGANNDGHAANHVEVEQIVVDESSLHTQFTRGRFTSYLQVRGSVPLHWFHSATQLPKPAIKLGVRDIYYTSTRKHFQELLEDYGAPLIIMNLLRQREKRPRESILSWEYRRAVMTLKGFVDADAEVEKKEEVLLYHEFDIRESAQGAWNNVTAFAEGALEQTGFFVCNRGGTRVQRQEGVLRSNCVDCVDRTNLAQFFFGLHALGHQLHALGLLYSPVDLALSPGVQDLLLRMYLLMGDAIAVQYGGSPQVGAGVLNRGTGWDQIMGIKRLYNNMVGDREKQSALNLFLGRSHLYPNAHSGTRDSMTHVSGAEVEEEALVLGMRNSKGSGSGSVFRNENSDRDSGHAAGRMGLRHFFESRKSRVGDLLEMDLEYSLQMKSALPPAKTDDVKGWWRDPLQRHQWLMFASTASSPSKHSSVGDVDYEAKNETEALIARMCIYERAAAMKQEDENAADEVSNGAAMQEGEVVALVLTTALNTLVRRTVMLPFRLYSMQKLDFMRSLMVQREADSETIYCESSESFVELLHNHHDFPDEVRASIFYQDIESVRRMSEECEPPDDMHRMHLAVLSMYGDPLEWNVETVLEALLEVEPKVSAETVNYLRRMNVDGYALLHHPNTADSMGQRELLRRFILLLKELPRASLESARRCCAELESETMEWTQTEEEESYRNGNTSGGSDMIAFPDSTCRLLQPFFKEAVYPATMGTVVRRLLQNMSDVKSGVPRSDRLRYREKFYHRVPPAVVATQCFSANELHAWLLRNSSRLGLTLHKHVEQHDASEACWKFMLWLAHANLVTHIIIEPSHGVIVYPVKKLTDFASRTQLFTLRPLQEMHVLNRDGAFKGDVELSVGTMAFPPPPPTGCSAVVCAESLVSVALRALSSVQEMTLTNAGDFSENSNFRVLLNALFALSTQLVEVDITVLRPRERWCFWVNVFNALYIHAWLAAFVLRAQDYPTFHNTNGYEIGGYFFSLSDIKNGLLRGNKPASYALLPPFETGDPRVLFTPTELDETADNYGIEMIKKAADPPMHILRGRILLALIDTFLVPDKLEDAQVYNPRTLFDEEEPTALQNSFSRTEMPPVNTTEINDSDDDMSPLHGGGDEEFALQELNPTARDVLRRAGNIPTGAATWLTSWFGNRLASKSAAFTHPCVPLIPATLQGQIYAIEGYVLRSLTHSPPQATMIRDGTVCPRALLPLLFYPEEFGTNADEIPRLIYQMHMNAGGRKMHCSVSLNSPTASISLPGDPMRRREFCEQVGNETQRIP